MSILTSFAQLYDKTQNPAFANYTRNVGSFEVNEHDSSASTKHLLVELPGAEFVSFNHQLVKGMADCTTKRSSYLQDSDCDGIAFMSVGGNPGLVLCELKSKFSTQKIFEAFGQMTFSFLKMHAMLSLSEDYSIDDISLHFIAACQRFEDKEQEDDVYTRLDKVEKVDGGSFEGRFIRKLIEHHDLRVKFGDVAEIYQLPLNAELMSKELEMSLKVTENFGDSSLVYTY